MVEFARTVDQCLKIGEKSSMLDQEELSRLQTENLALRQLMKIAAQNDYAAAKTFVDLIQEQAMNGNETPKSSDDQHTPTSEVSVRRERVGRQSSDFSLSPVHVASLTANVDSHRYIAQPSTLYFTLLQSLALIISHTAPTPSRCCNLTALCHFRL